MMPELPHPENKELTLAERRHLEFSEGWAMLGNPREAEVELDKIDPARQTAPEVFSKRWMLYDQAGWIAKRDALTPWPRKSVRKTLKRLVVVLLRFPFALAREVWRAGGNCGRNLTGPFEPLRTRI